MKKSFLVYLFALLIVTGFFAYVVYSQNQPKENNRNILNNIPDNTNIQINWQTYNNTEANFTLKYPEDWQLDEINSKANNKIFFVTDNKSRYDFSIGWENNFGRYNCEEIVDLRYQASLADFNNKNLSKSPDENETEKIKANFYPIKDVKNSTYSFCRLPDINKNSKISEHYLLVNYKNIFEVYFATSDAKNVTLFLPGTNNSLAKRMLDSITFADSETKIDNWQDYSNRRMGYSLKIPSIWFNTIKNYEVLCTVFGTNGCINDDFSSVDPKSYQGATSLGFDFYVTRYLFDKNKSLKEIYKNDEDIPPASIIKEGGYKIEVSEPETESINGLEAIHYSINATYFTEPGYIEETLIRNGDYVYDIEMIVVKKSYFDSYRDIAEEILNSFQVL